ncbi:MAG: hypothetical protein WCE62_05420 [Polyangiales bacterium]
MCLGIILVATSDLAGCGGSSDGGGDAGAGGTSATAFNEVYSCDQGGTCVDQNVMDSFMFEVLGNGTAQTVEGGQVIFSGPFSVATGAFGPFSGNGCGAANPCNETGTWTFVDTDSDGTFDSFSGASSYTYTQSSGGGNCVTAGNGDPAPAPASPGPVGACP